MYIIMYNVNKVMQNDIQLIQELKGHRGHVNSICVASSGKTVFSGDSVGEVIVWCEEETGDVGERREESGIIPSLGPQCPCTTRVRTGKAGGIVARA